MTRAVAFDIGTNTVRVLVVDAGTVVLRDHRVVSLGEGVDAAGRLGEAAMERTLRALVELRRLAGPVDLLDAVATSATRDAANRDVFLDRARDAIGVRPRMIPGPEEARLSFVGATAGDGGRPRVVVDIGGGSTEVVVGRAIPDVARSVDVGSVRLTERVLPERPAPRHAVERATAWAIERLAAAPTPDRPVPVLGVGGTFTSLAAIDADLPAYDGSVVHGWTLRADAAVRLVTDLAGRTVSETAAIPSLDPARAPVLLAGAVIALAVMRHLGVESIEVRETDLLDAIVADLTARA